MAVNTTPDPDFEESDAQDTSAEEIELDDGPGFEDEPEEAEAESDDTEVTTEEEDDDADDFDEDESESEQADDAEAEPETDAATTPEAPELNEDEQRKAHNKQMAEARLTEKARREAAIAAEQEEYLAQADPDDPKDAPFRQLQIDAYNNKVEANTNKLTNGYERAVKDYPILADSSPEVKAFVDDALDSFQALSVNIDKNGNPIDVRGDLYAYLQSKADAITALQGRGARKQVTDKTKQHSKAMAAPGRAPKTAKKDSDIDAFDEEANRW